MESSVQFEVDGTPAGDEEVGALKKTHRLEKGRRLQESCDPEWVGAVSEWGQHHITTSEEDGGKVFVKGFLKGVKQPRTSFSEHLPSARQSPGPLCGTFLHPHFVIFYLSRDLFCLWFCSLFLTSGVSLSLTVTFST